MNGSAETQLGREGPDLADAAMKERAEVQHWEENRVLLLPSSAYLNQTCMQRVQQGTELADSDRTKESETQTGKNGFQAHDKAAKIGTFVAAVQQKIVCWDAPRRRELGKKGGMTLTGVRNSRGMKMKGEWLRKARTRS